MFKLSQAHNQAFQAKAEADFVREVMQYLRENHAETIVKLPNGEFKVIDLPEQTLQKMVEGGIAKGRSYGLKEKASKRDFIVLMFKYSPNFDHHSEVQFLLTQSYLDKNYVPKILIEIFSNLRWKIIKMDYDSFAWF